MTVDGLDFIFDELRRLTPGVCAACGAGLPPEGFSRRHEFTCDVICHRVWIDRIVAGVGDTKILIDGRTGKRYVVPTRTILEDGIKASDLRQYPEAP